MQVKSLVDNIKGTNKVSLNINLKYFVISSGDQQINRGGRISDCEHR